MATFADLENAPEPAPRPNGTRPHGEGPLGPLCRRIRISVASGLSRGDRLSDGAVSKAGTHRLATRLWTEQVAEPGASVPPHVVGGARLSLLRSPGSDTMCCCDTAEGDQGL